MFWNAFVVKTRISDNLEPTEAKKAVSLINSYGDDALEMFKEGKSFDEVKKVVEGGIESFDKFNRVACEIGKRKDLDNVQKVQELQKLFKDSKYKTDVNVPKDVKYIKEFDSNGNVIYDWPMKLGFKDGTIEPITRENGLSIIWDRYGYMGGNNFADVPLSGKYTYSERAIPYLENEEAYHIVTFNVDSYFDKIDAIKNGNIDEFNKILKKENIEEWDIEEFEELRYEYKIFTKNIQKEIGNIDATYGVKGIASAWSELSGGARQFVMPLNGNIMKTIGILYE